MFGLDWNILSTGIGVLGIVIGYYFYRRSIKTPIPAYTIHALRVRIVDKTQMTAPGLQVVHNGHPLDAQNVTAATLYFWNDGRSPIHKGDVLKPYTIDFDKSAQVLESQTINVTRDVCGFRIFETDGQHVAVNFDIIESQDGVEVQVIYTGNPNATISVSGTCEGADVPKKREQVTMTAYEAAGAIVSASATFVLGTMFLFSASVLVRQMLKPMPGGFAIVGSDTNPWVVLLLLLPFSIAVTGIVYFYKAFRTVRKYTGFKNSAIEKLSTKARQE